MRQMKIVSILAVAMVFTVGCEEVELTFDGRLDDAMVDLEDELEAEGRALSTDPVSVDGTDRDRVDIEPVPEDSLNRRHIMRALRSLAARERCEIGGIIAGRYRADDSATETNSDDIDADNDGPDGTFRLRGYNFNGDRLAVAKGDFWSEGRGGDFSGQYETRSGATGLLGGEYLPSGEVFDDLGAFFGDWSSIDMDMVQFEGNIAGIWHPLSDQSGGIIVGYWSDCDDADGDETRPDAPAPIRAD
jgi:hypothetical protein